MKLLKQIGTESRSLRLIEQEGKFILETNYQMGVWPDGIPEDLFNKEGWAMVATFDSEDSNLSLLIESMDQFLKKAA